MQLTHLHVHSHYSLLDGLPSLGDLVDKALSLNMKALALTDHGNLYGAHKFHKLCTIRGLLPILGSEFYFVRDRSARERGYRHVILLAKNLTGWKNLMKLSSFSYLEGFYYKPRIDIELLKEFRKGVIALSACVDGIVAKHWFRHQDYSRALQAAQAWQRLFGEDFYLEIMPIDSVAETNQILFKISEELGIKLVATCDVHYIEKKDWKPHNIQLSIRGMGKSFDFRGLNFKSIDELAEDFQPQLREGFSQQVIAQAIENTMEVASKVESYSLQPAYEMPTDEELMEMFGEEQEDESLV